MRTVIVILHVAPGGVIALIRDPLMENAMKATIWLAVAASTALLQGCAKMESQAMAQAANMPPAAASRVLDPHTAQASRTHVANAAPLGLEIGVARLAAVKSAFPPAVLQDAGLNRYSGGRMLVGIGDGAGVKGVKRLVFIFDKDDVLVGTVVTLPGRAKDVIKALSREYWMVDNRIDPFTGRGYARLGKGDSAIEVIAPERSSLLQVRYLSKQLLGDVYRARWQEKAARAMRAQSSEATASAAKP